MDQATDGTATLIVKYEIIGAEKVAKVAVRRVATNRYIGTEKLWKDGPKINLIKNGGSLELSDLDSGDYHISR